MDQEKLFQEALNLLEGHENESEKMQENLVKSKGIFQELALNNHPGATYLLGFMNILGYGGKTDRKQGRELRRKAARELKALQFFENGSSQNENQILKNYSQFSLGLMLKNGEGAPKTKENFLKAIEILEASSKAGNAYASCILGGLYRDGFEGLVEQDDQKSLKLFEFASQKHNSDGLVNLAMIYLEGGKDIESNPQKGVELLERAAALGDSYAQNSLGSMYENGQIVEMDLEKAMNYFKSAAENGNIESQLALGTKYLEGNEIIQSDPSKAFEWIKLAAEQGDEQGQLTLGEMYQNGWGCEKDDEKAKFYFQLSAEQGNPTATFNLEYLEKQKKQKNISGEQTQLPEDLDSKFQEKAFSYLEKMAYEQNDATAQVKLGEMYKVGGEGIGEKNLEKAFHLFESGLKQKNSDGAFNIGLMYRNGEFVEQSFEKAFYYFSLGAGAGHVNSSLHLGEFFEKGIVVPKNLHKALAIYGKLGVEMGNEIALDKFTALATEMQKLGNLVSEDKPKESEDKPTEM